MNEKNHFPQAFIFRGDALLSQQGFAIWLSNTNVMIIRDATVKAAQCEVGNSTLKPDGLWAASTQYVILNTYLRCSFGKCWYYMCFYFWLKREINGFEDSHFCLVAISWSWILSLRAVLVRSIRYTVIYCIPYIKEPFSQQLKSSNRLSVCLGNWRVAEVSRKAKEKQKQN